jgi:flagellar FliJ protein
MKAFRFTLEAVLAVRQREENEALEHYAHALQARQQLLDLLEGMRQRISDDFTQMRELLAGGCTAAQAAQAQKYHRTVEIMRDECAASLEQAEQRVEADSQAMLAARQRREMVDVHREKQQAVHQRAAGREEQKNLDEFALRRVTTLHSAQTSTDHD